MTEFSETTEEYFVPDEKNKLEKGVLYLVATPIGNLSDVSDRCRKVLSGVDFVAAEDTRNSGLFLSRLGIKRPLVSYHEHNKASVGPRITERLKNGENCALISDAGTPAISDPGEDLVRLCAEDGLRVVPVPGCCAAVCALTVSALPTGRFVFEGFLPSTPRERRERLASVANEERTVILYEAPHRLRRTLDELLEVCGAERPLSLCRELTKLNEDIRRGTVGSAVEYYNVNEPRGEYVLVLGGKSPASEHFWDKMTVSEHVNYYVGQGISQKDAIKAAAHDRGVPKNEVYAEIVKNK